MNQKQIGGIIIIIAVLLGVFVYMMKEREEAYIQDYVLEQGTCFTDSGVCLHEQKDNSIYLGGALVIALLMLGLYLSYFDKTQKVLMRQHKEVSEALKESKEKDEFKAFLKGFSESEKKVLEQIKEQEGIKQSTLRYKTGMSKTSLSLILKHLEEKDIVFRKKDGKTKKIYLKNKY
tara:strand:- start:7632 stop:8159 length:528 start_codon:yes stop_codon:yes gene_type:complete